MIINYNFVPAHFISSRKTAYKLHVGFIGVKKIPAIARTLALALFQPQFRSVLYLTRYCRNCFGGMKDPESSSKCPNLNPKLLAINLFFTAGDVIRLILESVSASAKDSRMLMVPSCDCHISLIFSSLSSSTFSLHLTRQR